MAVKITRDAFIYLAPKHGIEETSAQCGPCRMFVHQSYLPVQFGGSRCIIHGSRIAIDEDDSCGFFVPWPTPTGKPNETVVKEHAAELAKNIPGSVTPEQSGLVDRLVQCHRCSFERNGATICGLYEKLNAALPDMFDLDTGIEPHACCNAQEPKE